MRERAIWLHTPQMLKVLQPLLFESLCGRKEKYSLILINKNFTLYKHLVVLTVVYALPPFLLQPPRNPL